MAVPVAATSTNAVFVPVRASPVSVIVKVAVPASSSLIEPGVEVTVNATEASSLVKVV